MAKSKLSSVLGIFFLLTIFILNVTMVSAVWWNPFTWFQSEDYTSVEKIEGQWYLSHIDDIQLENFDYSINNLDNGKAKICLMPKDPKSINNEVIQDSKATLRKNNIETKIIQPSDMETEKEAGNVKKMCIDVDIASEDYARFGSHSALFEYTNESISAMINDVEIGKLSLTTNNFDYKDGKPNINLGFGRNLLTHQFFIENWTNESITNLKTINLKNGEEVERGAELRYLDYENIEVPLYETSCTDVWNETSASMSEVCEQIEVGNTTALHEVWKDMDTAINGQDYVVGVFSNVEKGDYVDIDFDYYGISVLESPIDWATWTASLNVDLEFTSHFEGNVDDELGIWTPNDVGTTNVSGFYGSARHFDSTDVVNITDLGNLLSNTDFTLMWRAKASSTSGYQYLVDAQYNALASDPYIVVGFFNNNKMTFREAIGGSSYDIEYTGFSTGVWHTVTAVQRGNSHELWIDGTNVGNQSLPSKIIFSADTPYPIGNKYKTGATWLGDIDEPMVWSRALSGDEIYDIDNDDLVYTSGESPSVTLTSPANNSNFTTSSIDFEVEVTDDQYVENVSLYLDGSLEDTDTSHTNGTYYFNVVVSEGVHNWSILAYDNDTNYNQSETRYFNYTQPPVYVELLSPDNAFVSKNLTVNMSCRGYKDVGVLQLNMTIDGVLNQSITNSTPTQNLSISELYDFSEGEHNWSCAVTDGMASATSSTRTFEVDTTPFIEFLTPPTFINYYNTTLEYIPMSVNVSTLYFKNITYYLENVNGSYFEETYTNETYYINFTNMPDAHYHYNVTVCTTTDKCNTTETRHLNHDNTAPSVNITSPSILNGLGYDGLYVTFTANFSDIISLDSCWYNYNGTNTTFPCTNNEFNSTSFNITNHDTDMTFYANDTIGNLLTEYFDWNYMIYYINHTYEDPAVVGETSTFTYDAYWLNDSYSNINSYVNWNGVRKPLAITTTDGDIVNATSSFILTGLTEDANVTFYWEFLIDGIFYNTSTYTQEVRTIKIDDCSLYPYYLLNITLKDEASNQLINLSNETGRIEADLYINSGEEAILQYSMSEDVENPVYVCSELDLENRGFTYNLDISFDTENRVTEFYFVDEGDLSLEDTPINISLMDLSLDDSTTFLFKFYDEDGLEVPNSIVQVYRKYIGDGIFREVERAKEDDNGETHIHLVEEDVIYYFKVSYRNDVIYTSSTYNAKCLSTPCQIELEAQNEFQEFDNDWDLINGSYSIANNPSTRQVIVTYSLDDPNYMNLTIYKYTNNPDTMEVVGSSQAYSTGGALTVTVPQSAGNVSFIAAIYEGGELKSTEWVDFNESGRDYFGTTGVFMALLLILTLVLMAASEGEGTIVFTLLGLIVISALKLIDLDYYALVGFICAGVIIIWKVAERRRR